jgi:hypothetical protein
LDHFDSTSLLLLLLRGAATRDRVTMMNFADSNRHFSCLSPSSDLIY